MRDIGTLKERVDHAERHLKATETARNRESEALMETWRKIRERFTHQEAEIARYRSEVEALTDVNDEMSRMVDDLIGIIDGNIERGRDQTVLKIATLAGDLLASEPSPEDFAQFASDTPEQKTAQDTDAYGQDFETVEYVDSVDPIEIVELDDTDDVFDLDVELDHVEAGLSIPEALAAAAIQDDGEDADRDVTEVSLSPGIRNLIHRVEGTVGETESPSDGPNGGGGGFADFGDGAEPVEDAELARELKEIETLRNELAGLRDRIAAAES